MVVWVCLHRFLALKWAHLGLIMAQKVGLVSFLEFSLFYLSDFMYNASWHLYLTANGFFGCVDTVS